MSDSTETPGLEQARRAMNLLQYGGCIGTDGTPLMELDIVIGKAKARKEASIHLAAAFEEVDRLTAALSREEHEHSRTIDARDRASGAADALAYAIGTEEEIGEHSNLNDPWANALEVLSTRDEAVAAARLEGVKAGLAAAARACRLAELAQRRNGAVDTYAVGSRECALIIDEIDPAEVSDD